MYEVHDWAEVHRLYHREHLTKAAIARRLQMSRTTVIRLLELADPPRYVREGRGSKLDPFKDSVAAMLDQDPEVPANSPTATGGSPRTPGSASGPKRAARSTGG